MARHSRTGDPESIRAGLVELLSNYAEMLQRDDLRQKVVSLIPAFHQLRDLGSSLIPFQGKNAARQRILEYFLRYPFTTIDGDELMVVSGIGEWARRVRELRVEFGWWIFSGTTIAEMARDEEFAAEFRRMGLDPEKIKDDQYVLMRTEQDRDAALRWNTMNSIRKEPIGVKAKILAYFRMNVGREIGGEELEYLADKTREWTRRVRELRTEEGWPIATKSSGRPDLPVGVYVLEEDRQAYEHDRVIPDAVRVEVLERDHYACQVCGWSREQWRKEDPRNFLELHHKKQHAHGGENTADNLITLCNVCHDRIHGGDLKIQNT